MRPARFVQTRVERGSLAHELDPPCHLFELIGTERPKPFRIDRCDGEITGPPGQARKERTEDEMQAMG
jgi:hypothetical protein